MPNDINIIVNATDKASQVLKQTNKEIGKFGDASAQAAQKVSKLDAAKNTFANIGIAAASVTGAIYAAKRAWDFTKEGAELEYVRGKFENLSASIGTTSDALLFDLRNATKGLVTDSDLVASATDYMSLGLAKTRDQVVRLSKVSGALGMDMNQLVLTLTNKTTMRFDALGVSVDGFDERLQRLKDSGMDANAAFTEAFLQQAEKQIDLVGEKADTTAGKLDKLTTSWGNLMDAAKLAAAEGAGPVAETFTDVLDVVTEKITAIKMLSDAYDKGILTYKEATDAIQDVSWGMADANEVIKEQQFELDKLANGQLQDYAAMAAGASKETRKLTEEELKGVLSGLDYQGAQWKAADALRALYDNAFKSTNQIVTLKDVMDKAAQKADDYYSQFDSGIGSMIEARIEAKKWADVGGLQIQSAFEQINKAVAYGLDPDIADKFFRELEVEFWEAQYLADNMSFDQAAQNLADTLGIELEDAKALMDGMVSTAGILNGMRIAMTVDVSLTGKGAPLLGSGPGGATGIKQGANGKTVGYNAAGGPVSGGGAYVVGENGPELFVPPTSGAIVNNPMAKNMTGGGDGIAVYGNVIIQLPNVTNGKDAGPAIEAWFNQRARALRNSGASISAGK